MNLNKLINRCLGQELFRPPMADDMFITMITTITIIMCTPMITFITIIITITITIVTTTPSPPIKSFPTKSP